MGTDIRSIRLGNLRELVRREGTIAALAEKVSTDEAYLGQVLNQWQGRSLGSRLARRIESVLGLERGWMDVSHAPSVAESVGSYVTSLPAPRRIPLISWVQAGDWTDSPDSFHPGDGERMVSTDVRVGRHAYAVEVVGDSMEPDFPEGTILIVDPDGASGHRSFVIVRLPASNDVTFKQLMLDAGKQYLRPLNPRYPMMELPAGAVICGVVRQARWARDYD